MRIIHNPEWAKSPLKEDLEIFHSSDFFYKTYPSVLFIGGVHGDEPAGLQLAKDLLKWIQDHVSIEPLVPFKIQWALIPCFNPDGFKAQTRTNGNSVDLNRNYPCKSWVVKRNKDRYYPGPSPGSEPEIQALINLIQIARPTTIVHFHSWKPCIVKTGTDKLGLTTYLNQASQYKILETIGYDTPGSLSEYAWKENNIPVICIEESDSEPMSQVWPRWGPALKKIFMDLS